MLNSVVVGLLMGGCYAVGALITLILIAILYRLILLAWELVLDWRDKCKRVKTIYLKRGK